MAEIKQKKMHREVKIRDWGNSKAVRLTKDVLEEAGVNDTDNAVFDLEVDTDKIILTRKNKLTPFQKLFESYDGERSQPETLWDEVEPVGKEKW